MRCTESYVNDDPLAVVVVVLDGVEVVLAGVLRVLVHAVILVRAQLGKRPEMAKRKQARLNQTNSFRLLQNLELLKLLFFCCFLPCM